MDVFGVSETWLKNTDSISLPGYKFYPINRKVSKGAARGGVGIFIRNEIRKHVKICKELSNENFLWCKIKHDYLGYDEDVFLCIVYIPPECSSREKRINIDHFKTLKNTTAKIKSSNIILVGDFNSRTSNLDDTIHPDKHEDIVIPEFYSKIQSLRSNKDLQRNKYGKKLVEYCIATGSYIANGRTLGDFQGNLTCHKESGSSTVDYAIINGNMNKHVRYFQVLNTSIGSDHCPITLELKLGSACIDRQNTAPILKAFQWNEINKQIFLHRMKSENLPPQLMEIENTLHNTDDINCAVGKLSNILLPMEGGGGARLKKRKPKPKDKKSWYDASCYELSKRLKLTTKLLAASPTNPHLRGSFCKTRKAYKKLLKYKKREWKDNMIHKLEELESKDPNEYWKLVNELREKKQVDSYFQADTFTSFFEKLFSLSDHSNQEIEKQVSDSLDNITVSNEPDFLMDELKKAIKSLKNKTGPDRIPAGLLKSCPDIVLNIILKIINKIKNSNSFPDKWAFGLTSLLLKEGNDDDPNNYRAITITNALSKILAILTKERVEKWSTENKIQKAEQIGFTKKSRPADHLFVLKTIIEHYKRSGKKLYTCFVDFQKAFDSVWRTGLYYKLIKYGMNTGLVNLIRNMYTKTSQALKINGELSRIFRTYRGVPQGCILSPSLFNLFINDLPDIFDSNCDPVLLNHSKINCLLYADDLILFSDSSIGLQNCLDRLSEYTKQWDLKVNLKKTKIMVFQGNGRRVDSPFSLGNQNIAHTKSYKYLGTIISDTGNFKLNEINLKKKGLRASFLISKNIGLYAKPSISISIFEKVVEPILLYNSEITAPFMPNKWDYDRFFSRMWDTGKELNKVTLGFLRQTLGVHKNTSNLAILAETGKFPLCTTIFNRILKYWIRLDSIEHPLLKAARDVDRIYQQLERPCWSKMVYFLLRATGTSQMPIDSKPNINKTLKFFKQKIQHLFLSWWDNQKTTVSTKLTPFYYKHKKIFRFETYLDNIPRHIRTYLTRLRTSGHCLPVEVLRYNKKKIHRVDRKCPICNLGELGDEEHYLLRCNNAEISYLQNNFFKNIRVEVTQLGLFTNQNIIDYCLNMSDIKTQKSTALYCKQILQTYKDEIDGSKIMPDAPVVTKSGRLIKKPNKLDL